ncbi:MAG TPA: PEP-CTERM sorting domain-containing protein [Lacipirellulaceae bacterium]|nr:PEP-CTERM sorting domain-containing protein [Lacipirellulaceae bacterium]
MTTNRWLVVLGVLAIALHASMASAVLVPAGGAGSGVGWMEHAFGPVGGMTAPGGALADFHGFYSPHLPWGDPAGLGTSGGMRAPGFNYPEFPVVPWAAVFENDTGNFPMVANVVYNLATPPNITGFNGATTSMVGVGGGGRAGVAAGFALSDASPKGGLIQASTSTFAASVVYNSIGGTTSRFGHFLASNVSVPVGGFAAAGVKSIFEIGDHNPVTGAFFVDSFWEPLPILVGFDGAGGPLVDIIQAQFFNSAMAGQAGTFAALSTTPLAFIPHGKSIRMRSTVTLVADPDATMEMIPLSSFFDVFAELDGPFLGFGASSDAADLLVPEPAAGVLLLVGGCALAVRRKRR